MAVQLASSLDKRLRNLTDGWILAELMPRDSLDSQGNSISNKCVDCNGTIDDFRYTYAGVDGSWNEFWLTHEKAHTIFKWYSTMEIIQPPIIAVDKKEALKAKNAAKNQAIAVRRKEKSEIRAEED